MIVPHFCILLVELREVLLDRCTRLPVKKWISDLNRNSAHTRDGEVHRYVLTLDQGTVFVTLPGRQMFPSCSASNCQRRLYCAWDDMSPQTT